MRHLEELPPTPAAEPMWKAWPAQEHFIRCPCYEVAWLGEKGGGKTDALLMEPLVNQYQPAQERFLRTGKKSHGWVLFVRKELGRMKEAVSRALELFPQLDPDSVTWPGYGWSQMEKIYRFTNGFRFEFGHLDDPHSHHIYNGRQFSRVIVDEAPEVPFEQVQFLKAQIRVQRGREPYLEKTLGLRVAGNPYGMYADWLKKRYVDNGANNVVTEMVRLPDGKRVPRTRVWIPSYLKDNPSLDYEAYAATLTDLPEHMRRAFLYGDWNYVPGSYFGEVWDPKIHVCDPFEIPEHWEIFRGGDWGSREPACCLWATVDNDNNLIILDELYGPGITGVEWAREIRAREEERGWSDTCGWLDPGAWAEYGSAAPSPGDDMLAEGVSWWPAEKGKGSINLALVELTRRMKARSATGIPGLLVFSRCKNLIRTIPMLRTDPDNVDELEKLREDHAIEALRALAMAKPLSPELLNHDQELRRWERIARSHEQRKGAWYPWS